MKKGKQEKIEIKEEKKEMQEEYPTQTKGPNSNIIMETLLAFLELREMVQVYTNYGDTQKFSVGFVQALTSSEILIAHITPYGKYDGYIVKQLKDIYRIESHSQYLSKLKKLHSYEIHTHAIVRQAQGSLFFNLLDFAQQNKSIVSIELLESDNDDIIGFVDSLENEFAVIKAIDMYGKIDGINCIRISDITHLVCDSEDEMALKLLSGNSCHEL